ncbi:hypothetical protein SAMN06297144_2897 [Sphingomonas guangdongensis]|uniref:Uncharacterized protein n=1 Tax=Sphingomonas guangdongensis TaxID=1141890 RepID=A0A285R0Y6_9SPHN|nr:hypothetical protein [Sphingomonas guangdongensis]SOB87761.1 hypothetical protein SAMN06297144_2897 [Sphingomonas guangdongensis]
MGPIFNPVLVLAGLFCWCAALFFGRTKRTRERLALGGLLAFALFAASSITDGGFDL